MAEVRYENATRVYPGAERPAVDALTLAIRDGEFVVMAGLPRLRDHDRPADAGRPGGAR